MSLPATARLFGRLLLKEIDDDLAATLESPEVAAAMSEAGVTVPPLDAASRDDLAAEYFETILRPTDRPPPIQSLVEEATYEGQASKGVREVAQAAGLEFQREPARGAPPDHLGSELLLWADLEEQDPEAAQEFARRHLAWAGRLYGTSAGDRFYEQMLGAVGSFVRVITS